MLLLLCSFFTHLQSKQPDWWDALTKDLTKHLTSNERRHSFKMITQLHINMFQPTDINISSHGIVTVVHYFYIKNYLIEPTVEDVERMYIPE
jgi:hypothetical protein